MLSLVFANKTTLLSERFYSCQFRKNEKDSFNVIKIFLSASDHVITSMSYFIKICYSFVILWSHYKCGNQYLVYDPLLFITFPSLLGIDATRLSQMFGISRLGRKLSQICLA